jgi:hypothetical protein
MSKFEITIKSKSTERMFSNPKNPNWTVDDVTDLSIEEIAGILEQVEAIKKMVFAELTETTPELEKQKSNIEVLSSCAKYAMACIELHPRIEALEKKKAEFKRSPNYIEFAKLKAISQPTPKEQQELRDLINKLKKAQEPLKKEEQALETEKSALETRLKRQYGTYHTERNQKLNDKGRYFRAIASVVDIINNLAHFADDYTVEMDRAAERYSYYKSKADDASDITEALFDLKDEAMKKFFTLCAKKGVHIASSKSNNGMSLEALIMGLGAVRWHAGQYSNYLTIKRDIVRITGKEPPMVKYTRRGDQSNLVVLNGSLPEDQYRETIKAYKDAYDGKPK